MIYKQSALDFDYKKYQLKEANNEFVKTLVIVSVLSENHGSWTLGAALESNLTAQHEMETFKMDLARSLECEFSEKLIF